MLVKQLQRPSGCFGATFGFAMARGHAPLYAWTLDLLGLQAGEQVLDLGCGSGKSTALIAAQLGSGFAVGLDHSVTMVRQARRRNAKTKSAGRTAISNADASNLPFADAHFDRVCAIETFYFWPKPQQSLREIWRVLRPGGLVAITMEGSREPGPQQATAVEWSQRYDFDLYSAADMQTLLERAGFRQVRFEREPEKGGGWLCSLAKKLETSYAS